jgi:hypothetical protein
MQTKTPPVVFAVSLAAAFIPACSSCSDETVQPAAGTGGQDVDHDASSGAGGGPEGVGGSTGKGGAGVAGSGGNSGRGGAGGGSAGDAGGAGDSSVEGGPVDAPATSCGTSDRFTVTEMLADRAFANGIQMWNGPYDRPDARTWTSDCQARWATRLQLPSKDSTSWIFTEIGERTLLCNESSNPTIDGGSVIYTNPTDRGAAVGAKRIVDFTTTTAGVSIAFDSGEEWRGGCGLTAPDELNDAALPVYADQNGKWNWDTLLLTQVIKDPNDTQQRLMIDRYHKLTFDITLQMTKSDKVLTPYLDAGECPEWKNHALFYIGFILSDTIHVADDGKEDPTRRFYAIFPAWQTYDGTPSSPTEPFLADDPLGAKVYWTGIVGPGRKYGALALGQEKTYSIDLQELAAEAIGGYNQKNAGASWSTADYSIRAVEIGWEIWGGYDTEVTVKNPSLKAYAFTQHACPALYRYWNPSIGDHYYSKDFMPAGFLGYAYEGAAARIPTINMSGTVKLWRYWNAAGGDHYYSTNLQPLGITTNDGSWLFERQAGSIFRSSLGAAYDPFEEWWCADNVDHMYQLASATDPTSCYTGPSTLGWLAKP